MQENELTLTFKARQTAIRRSSWFEIGTIYGKILAEYTPAMITAGFQTPTRTTPRNTGRDLHGRLPASELELPEQD